MKETEERLDALEEKVDSMTAKIGALSNDFATLLGAFNSYETFTNKRLVQLGSASAHIIAAIEALDKVIGE